ncbi:histidine phosphatase family protein [Oleidesulfovibrio sp.]|uniref:histidine phosphatase family protein n=1 Tax=Oleidesulfovibrio sp. TaxID=2909707 RepID=UPI003A8520E8
MKRIIIVRHGNTFRKGETPTRVGGRTDLPLVEGERSKAVGKYLVQKKLIPDVIYVAPLKRTLQTKEFILEQLGRNVPVEVMDDFVEIDYGPDENKPEDEVLLRLGCGDAEAGKLIIEAWNKNGTVPDGWVVDPEQLIRTWKNIGSSVAARDKDDYTALIVSSNGIIRFAPYLTGDFALFTKHNDIKVATGGLCIFEKHASEEYWRCVEWNTVPVKLAL